MAAYTRKDVYTEYFSGSVVITPPPSNIEFTAGVAQGGQLMTRYTISDKATAISLFKGGDLLDALIERLDAGSSMIYALRIGPAEKASIIVTDGGTPVVDVMKLEAVEPGTWWNDVAVEVSVEGANITVEITDPDGETTYDFTSITLAGLVDAINGVTGDGQPLVAASIVTGPNLPGVLDTTYLTGGKDGDGANGDPMTTQDIMDAITFSEQFTDVAWAHFIGAADFDSDPWGAGAVETAFETTRAMWSAILTSCENMVDNNLGERFALLDFPRFEAVNPDLPTVTEIQTYTDRAILAMSDMANQNAVFILGEGKFIDSDGVIYLNRLTSAVSGKMAAVDIQKSLLGESPVNISALTPEFSLGQQTQLVTANINHLRVEPGIGKIIALSNVACPTGSTYNRIEKLRAVYSAGKQVRTAAFPHLGRANDSAGEGIQLLEADLKKPLDLMVQKRQIDTYELTVECTPEMRTLGEANVILSVNSMKAFEIILTKVYLD
ncbi:MAG: hypothetical protein H8E87_01525 [FCB group bacterium]|nr:hypothetical protein [FCB group bacterium]